MGSIRKKELASSASIDRLSVAVELNGRGLVWRLHEASAFWHTFYGPLVLPE